MVIRQWRETDRGALLRLAKSAPDSDTGDAILAALRVPAEFSAFNANPTLVAIDGDNLIGIGTLWENEIHPARWRVSLFGRSTFWSQDAAAFLLAALRDLRPDPRPLQFATSARNEDIATFFENHGFSLLMRTCCGVLPPGEIPGSIAKDFDDASEWITGEGIRVVPLEAFRNRPFSYTQLARLHADIYIQGHTWDPVRELTGGELAELFLDSEELLLDATYVALQRKRLVGVTSLRGTGIPGRVELGWTGSVLDDPQQRKHLVHALLGMSLRHAASANWHVSFEVDEADTVMWDMVTQLPLAREPDWLTFAEAGPDPGAV
jgi:hypothetical protein